MRWSGPQCVAGHIPNDEFPCTEMSISNVGETWRFITQARTMQPGQPFPAKNISALVRSNAQPTITHTYFVDLRTALCQTLGNQSVKLTTLLGGREILEIENLNRSILLDKSEDQERIVIKLGAVGGMHRNRCLCRDASLPETVWRF